MIVVLSIYSNNNDDGMYKPSARSCHQALLYAYTDDDFTQDLTGDESCRVVVKPSFDSNCSREIFSSDGDFDQSTGKSISSCVMICNDSAAAFRICKASDYISRSIVVLERETFEYLCVNSVQSFFNAEFFNGSKVVIAAYNLIAASILGIFAVLR